MFCLQIILKFNIKFQVLVSFLIINLNHQFLIILIFKPKILSTFAFLHQYHYHRHRLFQKSFNSKYFKIPPLLIYYNLFYSLYFIIIYNLLLTNLLVIHFCLNYLNLINPNQTKKKKKKKNMFFSKYKLRTIFALIYSILTSLKHFSSSHYNYFLPFLILPS